MMNNEVSYYKKEKAPASSFFLQNSRVPAAICININH